MISTMTDLLVQTVWGISVYWIVPAAIAFVCCMCIVFVRSLEKSAAVLVLVGLIFIGIGAFDTAQAVIITDDQAKQLGTTMWGSNPGLIESFKEQSRAARNGLYLIVGGTILQIIGTIIPFKRIG